MKKFFKQLFCKHEWEEKNIMEVVEDFGGILQILEEKRYKICKKCGKKQYKEYTVKLKNPLIKME